MDCVAFEEKTEDYLLHILPASNQAEAEAHAQVCAPCHEAAEDFRAALEGIALAVPLQEPPRALRSRVLNRIRAEIQTGSNGSAPAPTTRREPVSFSDSFAKLRRAKWPLAAAACFTLAVGTLAWNASLQRQLDVQRTQFGWADEDLSSAIAAAADPQTGERTLKGSEVAPLARGRLFVEQAGTRVLFVSDMPVLKPGMAYQVWLIQDGRRVSAGLFKVDAAGRGYHIFTIPQDTTRYQALGVTMEPESGSPGPTSPRVIGGDL